MRYIVEHQRNVAFDLLWLLRNGTNIADYFQPYEKVIIYGYDFLGCEIYEEIKAYVNIIGFIDRSHDGQTYDGIKVYSLENPDLVEAVSKFTEVKVVIVILSDIVNIVNLLTSKFENINPISVYEILGKMKMKCKQFYKYQNDKTVNLINRILNDQNTEIDNIVLVGTSYTCLLGMLYLKDWENTLYIFERFVNPDIANKVNQYGSYCLYENNAVECYDICYLIAKYAKKHEIPIWGHDHMQLSRPFLENGINVLEDGKGNYEFEYSRQYLILLDNGRVYTSLGYDQLVKKVVLTGMFKIPNELLNKVEVVKVKDLWNTKSESEKSEIADIFKFPYSEIMNLINKGKKILFLTEPNVSVGEEIISKETQLCMYREILAKYPEQEIMIKPHPADDIQYAKEMPQYAILEKNFPIQLILWSSMSIDKVVVMESSSCIDIFKSYCEIDVYTDDGKKLNS